MILKTVLRKQLTWSQYRHIRELSVSQIPWQHPIKQQDTEETVLTRCRPAVSNTLKNAKKDLVFTAPKFNSTLKSTDFPDIGQPTPYTHPHLFYSYDEENVTYRGILSRRVHQLQWLNGPKNLEEDIMLTDMVCRGVSVPTNVPKQSEMYFKSFLICDAPQEKVTPGITGEEYATRRQKIMKILSEASMGSKHGRHLLILPAATLKIMSNDIPYFFHQDSAFLYLTGLNEPDGIMVLDFHKVSGNFSFMLFTSPKDPKRELWDGAVVGQHQAVQYFHADQAFPLSMFSSIMKDRYGTEKSCVWYPKKTENAILQNLINSPLFGNKDLKDISYYLQLLRLVKSPAEIKIIQKSVSIASQAFTKEKGTSQDVNVKNQVIKNTTAGLPESHLHALLSFECQLNGAQHLSFPPVVAGGNRANTLHYINNTQILRNGDLVLMDGGCEYNGYASDLTRTFPVSGKFTQPQKELYEIVLRVQKACIQVCKPGVSMDTLHHVMLITLGQELQDIGFIKKQNYSEVELKRKAAIFCPHHLGHYLGMDTHDTPLVHRGLPLQNGFVFTVEPGIYIEKDNTDVPEKYRGIGIRIEDDVMMTENGAHILSAELPKEIYDIEELMAKR